jgi:nitrate/nitrite transporter NarK
MAGVLMGALKAFSQWYPPDRFTMASGFLIGIGTLGSLASATPLSWLTQTIGWRSVFAWGGLVIAASSAAIMLWTRNTPPGVPWPAGARTEGGLGSIFSDVRFWRIALLSFFMTGTQLGTQGLWAGPYLFDVARLTRIAAGNVLLWMAVGVTVGCTVSGWLAGRLGVARVITASVAVFLFCQVVLILIPPTSLLRLAYLLFGLSGAFNVMLLAHVRFVFPPALTGRAVTAVNVFGLSGTFLLQWVMGLIIGTFPADGLGHYPPQAYSAAFGFTAAGTLAMLLWYLPLTRAAAPAYDR